MYLPLVNNYELYNIRFWVLNGKKKKASKRIYKQISSIYNINNHLVFKYRLGHSTYEY